MLADAKASAAHFAIRGKLAGVEPFGYGHINDSYVLTCRRQAETIRYLLQRINDAVFPKPAEVMENIQRVTEHIAKQLQSQGVPDARRRVLTLVPTRAGEPYHRDSAGSYWRLYPFIDGTRVYAAVETPEQAYQAGRAFATFQRLLANLPSPRLHETIPEFHTRRGGSRRWIGR